MACDRDEQLLDLISSRLSVDRSRLSDDAALFHDLGVAGLTGESLLVSIAESFDIEMSEVNPDWYFGPEIGYNPFFHLWMLLQGRRLDEGIVRLRIGDLKTTVAAGEWIEPGS